MRVLIAYVLTFLGAAPLWLNAQEQSLHYIWNRKGVPVYTAPSAGTALDTLSYGTAVNIIAVRPEMVDKVLFTCQFDTVVKAYSLTAKWLMGVYADGQKRYIASR